MAAAMTRRLNVDPLMRTRLGGASVTGTLTPFPTPVGSQQNSTFTQARLAFDHGIVTLSLSRAMLRRHLIVNTDPATCIAQVYPNRRLLVYKHTHHVYTHSAGRRPAFRFH